MAITRKIYTNSVLTILSNHTDLHGGSNPGVKLYAKPDTVQNATFTLTIPRADVNAFGVKGVVARPTLEAHSANIEFSFIPRTAGGTSSENAAADAGTSQLEEGDETPVGPNTAALSELDINALMDDTLQNSPKYVAVDVQEVGALKNALMTSFSADASVGALPTFSMSFIGAVGVGDYAGGSSEASGGATATTLSVVEPKDITVGTSTQGCVQSLAWAWDIPVELVLCLGGDPASDGEALSSPPGTASKTIEGLAEVAEANALTVSNIGVYQFNIGAASEIDSRTHNMAVGELFATYNYVVGSTADSCTMA